MKGGRYLEEKHVQNVYDTIAPSFNDIPQKVWPNVKKFIKSLEPGSLVADIGCGNGRYLHINKSVFKLGIDVCYPLVELSREKGYEVLVADNQILPFKDGAFDAVISIGVLHHFSTEDRRIQALTELSRVLRPGGKLLVYVWAYEQKHRRFDGQDVLVPWHAGKKNKQTGRCSSDPNISSTSSTRDLSSTSSVSEDDSAESSVPRHYIQRTHSDPSCPSQSVQPSLLCKLLNSSTKPLTSRQRSNTLPSSLEAFNDTHHGNSQIEEECRKLQMSLREMSASHDHLSASNDSVFCCEDKNRNDPDEEENGIIFESRCENTIETNNKEMVSNDKDKKENIGSSGVFTEFDMNYNQNMKEQKQEIKKHKKISIFESLKKRFLKFIDLKDSDDEDFTESQSENSKKQCNLIDSQSENSKKQCNLTESQSKESKQQCFMNDGSLLLHDINLLGCFAVREFPMSSFPDNRLNSPDEPFSKSENHSLEDRLLSDSQGQIHNIGHNKSQNNIVKCKDSIHNDKFLRPLDKSEKVKYESYSETKKTINGDMLNVTTETQRPIKGNMLNVTTETQRPIKGNLLNSSTDNKSHHNICKKKTNSNGASDSITSNGDLDAQTNNKYVNYQSTENPKKSSRMNLLNGNTGLNGNSGKYVVKRNRFVKSEKHVNGFKENGVENVNRRTQSQSTYLSSNTNIIKSQQEIILPSNDCSNLTNNKINNCQISTVSNIQLPDGHNTMISSDNNCEISTVSNIQLPDGHYTMKSSDNNCEISTVSNIQLPDGHYTMISSDNNCLYQNTQSSRSNVPMDQYIKDIHSDQNHINTCSENISSSQTCLSIDNPLKSHDIGAEIVPSHTKKTDDEFQMSPARLCRYYHVFREGELSTLIQDNLNDLSVNSCIYDHGNWCLKAEKLGAV